MFGRPDPVNIAGSGIASPGLGISRTHAIRGLTASAMYFTSFEGLSAAYEAMADILEDWPDQGQPAGT